MLYNELNICLTININQFNKINKEICWLQFWKIHEWLGAAQQKGTLGVPVAAGTA